MWVQIFNIGLYCVHRLVQFDWILWNVNALTLSLTARATNTLDIVVGHIIAANILCRHASLTITL